MKYLILFVTTVAIHAQAASTSCQLRDQITTIHFSTAPVVSNGIYSAERWQGEAHKTLLTLQFLDGAKPRAYRATVDAQKMRAIFEGRHVSIKFNNTEVEYDDRGLPINLSAIAVLNDEGKGTVSVAFTGIVADGTCGDFR